MWLATVVNKILLDSAIIGINVGSRLLNVLKKRIWQDEDDLKRILVF
jgi:hypothetical protein